MKQNLLHVGSDGLLGSAKHGMCGIWNDDLTAKGAFLRKKSLRFLANSSVIVRTDH